jgi:hypothetical protein
MKASMTEAMRADQMGYLMEYPKEAMKAHLTEDDSVKLMVSMKVRLTEVNLVNSMLLMMDSLIEPNLVLLMGQKMGGESYMTVETTVPNLDLTMV